MTYQQKNSISNHVNMWRFDGFLGPPTLFTVAGFTRHEATSEYLGILHCEEKKPLAGRSRWWGGNDPRREGEETFRPSVFWGQDTIEFSKEAEVFILEEANCECWCFSWYSWLPKRERERERLLQSGHAILNSLLEGSRAGIQMFLSLVVLFDTWREAHTVLSTT